MTTFPVKSQAFSSRHLITFASLDSFTGVQSQRFRGKHTHLFSFAWVTSYARLFLKEPWHATSRSQTNFRQGPFVSSSGAITFGLAGATAGATVLKVPAVWSSAMATSLLAPCSRHALASLRSWSPSALVRAAGSPRSPFTPARNWIRMVLSAMITFSLSKARFASG